jgi:hypothetical protein
LSRKQIAKLTTEVKELRSEFVDRRSQLMKLKMESTVSQKWWKTNFPIDCSSNKSKKEEKTFLKKNMAVEDKHISYRIYLVAFAIFW